MSQQKTLINQVTAPKYCIINGQRVELNVRVNKSGHTTYWAICNGEKYVVKANKNGSILASVFEMALGALAKLCAPKNTSETVFAYDEGGKIFGVASRHYFYNVQEKVRFSGGNLQTVKPNARELRFSDYDPQTDQEPLYFFDSFESNFFIRLRKLEAQGKISLDMDSLASVLTVSYFLEEDDLHKGNIGVYFIKKGNVIQAVFFKIDHDLLLSDSIMSFYDGRFANLFHGKSAVNITRRDLVNFPNIADSDNHYFPTKKRYFVPPFDKKVWTREEVREFKNLAPDPRFIKGKWRSLYRDILLTEGMMKNALKEQALPVDDNPVKNKENQAKRAVIMQAAIARQSRMRAALFATPDFRDYVSKLTVNEREDLIQEIVEDDIPCKLSTATKDPRTLSLRSQEKLFASGYLLYENQVYYRDHATKQIKALDLDEHDLEAFKRFFPERPSSDNTFKYHYVGVSQFQRIVQLKHPEGKWLTPAVLKAQSNLNAADLQAKKRLREEITREIERHVALVPQFAFNDTPVHAAIRLGDYRYDETIKYYGKYLNSESLTSLVAASSHLESRDIRDNKAAIAAHLRLSLNYNSASSRATLAQVLNNLVTYKDAVEVYKTSDKLIEFIATIGDDNRYTLKMKKNLAIGCVNAFIAANQGNKVKLREELWKFKKELNKKDPPNLDLQFISQLQSSIWLMRKIRGMFGGTNTKIDLNKILDNTIKKIPSPYTQDQSLFAHREFRPTLSVMRPVEAQEQGQGAFHSPN